MKSFIVIILILICFLFSSSLNAADEPDISWENNEYLSELLFDEILDSADTIISSKQNVTTATQLLAALPERENKKTIAVYRLTDKTGQIKELGSTVVTQGVTEMLITALDRSRQFKILDRSNFNDFMNEQNLQANSRLLPGENPYLGELWGADYVIEGAVTEYQVDKKSGGLGLLIGGFGGSQQYAVASTAVDLRLVNTTTGEVVWTQSLKNELKGEKVGIQAFSFLGNNIVEFETGQGKQEVINLSIRTLLEEAVFLLTQKEYLFKY